MSLEFDTARKQLRALDRRLRELIAVAGSRAGDLGPVWKDCEEIGQSIAEIAFAAHDSSPQDKDLLVDEMTSLHELFAIATEYLQREQAAVASLLRQVRQSKESLAYYAPDDDSGQSCDVAG